MSYAHILGTMYERSSYYDKGFIIDELMLYHIIYDLYHDPYRKCPFLSAKKWHFERPNLRTDSKNLAKHPPKWWGRVFVHAFPFSGEYQANFWKLQILAPPKALLPLWLSQTQKWTAEYRLWVYNSEIWFLGSPNLSAPLVFWPLKNSKVGQKRYGLLYIDFAWSCVCAHWSKGVNPRQLS